MREPNACSRDWDAHDTVPREVTASGVNKYHEEEQRATRSNNDRFYERWELTMNRYTAAEAADKDDDTQLGEVIVTEPYIDAIGSTNDWLVTLARAVYR